MIDFALHPLIAASGALGLMGLIFGAALGFAAARFRLDDSPTMVKRIDALLPQSQCGQCGYAGCRPYAEAVSAGEAINRCAPGGDKTIAALANLLNVTVLPLDIEGDAPPQQAVAFIREAECIGCTKCIQACPVDAIVGAAKHMHTVIASECTGCDLCVDPCPVDCIEIRPLNAQRNGPRAELALRQLIATDGATPIGSAA